MKRQVSSRWNSNLDMRLFCLACVTTLAAYGLPAHGQQASQSIDPASEAPPRASADAASTQCPPPQHFDPDMGMCMAGEVKPKSALMFQLNQFFLYSNTSGPRGNSRATGPGTWMLMYDNDLTPNNHLSIDVMGSPEQLTVGDKGTPQLLQTENVDNMHAHDTIMALELRDAVAIDAGDKQKLTFLFAPRGEAAIGPVPFMHRDSAEGNPDAPLGHARQDGFHDASTVLGVEYQFARTTLEATAFSGHNISWPFPLHGPDSYGFRVNQGLDDHFSIGASYADALLPNDAGGAEHNQFISAWLTTSHQIHGNGLKSSFVWGAARAGHGAFLNSLLEEAVYQRGQNKLYGRAEVLQIAPDQLDFSIPNSAADPRWVGAFTVGYERTLLEKDGLALLLGGSYTKDWIPASFRPAYGSDPRGAKVYLRVKFMRGIPGF